MKYECPLNYFGVLDNDQISEKYEIPRNLCVAVSRLAPHFQDEIVSLKKWLFLAGFLLFLAQLFLHVTHIYRHDMDILRTNRP